MNRLLGQVPQLIAVRSDLEQLASGLMDRFLAIGNDLRSQTELAKKLVTQGERLAVLAAHDGVLQAAVVTIERTIKSAEDCHRQTEVLARQLEDYRAKIEQLHKAEAELQQKLSPMRTVRTLLQIETASLPAELQAVFASVALEIARVDGESRACFELHNQHLEETLRTIIATSSMLHERAAKQRSDLDVGRKRIQTSLAKLETELRAKHEHDEQMLSGFRDIEHDTGTVVVALQYQDITKQQMEHVQEGLAEIEERTNAARDGYDDGDVCYLAKACRLEARQVDQIDNELAHAAEAIFGGFHKIAGRLNNLGNGCLSPAEFGKISAALDAIAASLLAAATEADCLLNGIVDVVREAAVNIRTLDKLTAEMTSSMRQLSIEIRLIGLNAQIQAVHVKRPALEALSGETYAISCSTDELIATLDADLGSASAFLDKIIRECETLDGESKKQRSLSETQGRQVSGQLSGFRAEVSSTMSEIESLFGALREQIGTSLGEADLQSLSRETLAALRTNLDRIADESERVGYRVPKGAGVNQHLGPGDQRYTMKSERNIHAAVLAGENPVAAPSKQAPVAVEVEAGGNIELF